MTRAEKIIAFLNGVCGACIAAGLCDLAFGEHPTPMIIGAAVGFPVGVITSLIDIRSRKRK